MTIAELIKELSSFDENLIVVYDTQEDTYEPAPRLETYDFNTNYYNGRDFVTLPRNTPFVKL